MKKILVTGSAGFIGSHLAENFLNLGFSVVGIDDLSGSYSDSYYRRNISLLNNYRSFKLHKINILNKKGINQLVSRNGFDFILHCAAKTSVRKSTLYPEKYSDTNVLGTQLLLEAVKEHSPWSKIVLFSSSAIYGDQKVLPFNEEMVPHPISFYGLSKYLMEQIGNFYRKECRLLITIVRPFSVFGPRGREDMLPALLLSKTRTHTPFSQFGNNLNNQRDWTYVADIVTAITRIVKHHNPRFLTTINLGGSQPVGIENFVKLFSQLTKKRVKVIKKPLDKSEISVVHADISKAKELLGFLPSFSLEKGLRLYIKWSQGLSS